MSLKTSQQVNKRMNRLCFKKYMSMCVHVPRIENSGFWFAFKTFQLLLKQQIVMTVNSKGRCKNYHFLVFLVNVVSRFDGKWISQLSKSSLHKSGPEAVLCSLLQDPRPGYNRQLCLRQNNSMTWRNGMLNKPLLRQKQSLLAIADIQINFRHYKIHERIQ